MKIFFYALREFDELKYCREISQEYGISFDWTPEYPSLNNAEMAEGCEAVSMTPCEVAAPLLEKFHDLGVRYITCRSIGYDHVDLDKAAELGMRVSNVSYPPDGVANYAIMLMMMCSRRIVPILRRSELQDYSLKGKIGRDISNCTIGVIGTGKIGSTVIRHLSGFGCRLLAYDPFQNPAVKRMAEYVDLDRLYRESDIITLHTNATPENYHLLNAEAFDRMKDQVIIINTSRGKLIDTPALIKAIEEGKVGSAGLDVLEKEDGLYYHNRMGDIIRNTDMMELRSFPNVLLSPHTAFYTEIDVMNMVKRNFEAVDAFEHKKETALEVGKRVDYKMGGKDMK